MFLFINSNFFFHLPQKSTSFVYGAVSCFEKVLGGVVIGVVENFNPDTTLLPLPVAQAQNITICYNNVNVTPSSDSTVTNYSNVNVNVNHSHSTPLTTICDNGLHPVQYYKYIMSYGNAFILTLMLAGLLSIMSIKLNNKT